MNYNISHLISLELSWLMMQKEGTKHNTFLKTYQKTKIVLCFKNICTVSFTLLSYMWLHCAFI